MIWQLEGTRGGQDVFEDSTRMVLIGMRRDVTNYVRKCEVQQNKLSQLGSTGLLQLLLVPSLIWDEVSMAFIGLPLRELTPY